MPQISHQQAVSVVKAYAEEKGTTYATLSERFGVSVDAIRNTVTGKTEKGRVARDRYETELCLRRIGFQTSLFCQCAER